MHGYSNQNVELSLSARGCFSCGRTASSAHAADFRRRESCVTDSRLESCVTDGVGFANLLDRPSVGGCERDSYRATDEGGATGVDAARLCRGKCW